MQSEQIAAIHAAGLRTLAETGVVLRDAEAVRLFADRGCRVDGERVWVTEELVTSRVSRLRRRWRSRDEALTPASSSATVPRSSVRSPVPP